MSITTRARRGLFAGLTTALVAGGLALGVGAPAQAAEEQVQDATFTWGLSGYAQKGIFGPWTYKDLTGNVTQLTGSVSGGSQTEYAVDPVPATSMPVSSPQKTANAVRFTEGKGSLDRSTGAGSLTWTGSYTVNAYPAMYNAPNEIYSDPKLTVAADGSGTLTMDFALGEGKDMLGNPVEGKDFGRVELMTFDAGSLSARSDTGFRVTPDYQGVEFTPTSGTQDRTCTTANGATGWWGAWPTDFLEKLDSSPVGQSVLPHFYSTGCGGMNDNKPALPFDVTYPDAPSEDPKVTVDRTTVANDGTTEVTVTGTGFDPDLATGVRPPLQGKKAGVYVAFGRFADTWRPSEGAPSSSRSLPSGANGNGAGIKWALPAESRATLDPDSSNAAYADLAADGSFSVKLSVNQAWIDRADGSWGVYTYAGSGAAVAAYETATPLTFAKASTATSVTAATSAYGARGSANVTVEGATSGDVTLSGDGKTWTAPVDDAGKATFALPNSWVPGKRTLTASYAGTDTAAASQGTVTHTVTKATPIIKRIETLRSTRKKAGWTRVKITWAGGGGSAPTGTIRAWITRKDRKLVGPAVGVRSKATFPKATSAGTWKLHLRYYGDNKFAAVSDVTPLLSFTVK